MPASARAYVQPHDAVRNIFEERFFAGTLPALLARSGGGAMLDLGCGDGLAGRLAGAGLTRYVGVDFAREPAGFGDEYVQHDLSHGLGPLGRKSFDLYAATFGFASHLAPAALRRLLRELAAHARPGAVVALEALGLHSLEWPRLWHTSPGRGRTLGYRLGAEVEVHPWAPHELAALYAEAGIRPLAAIDRNLQAGPKTDGRYWPGLPPVRDALTALLGTGPAEEPRATLAAPLPPLPAGTAAAVHHTLTARRRNTVRAHTGAELAEAVWAIEPRSGGGYGHGLLMVGRVP